MSTGQQWWADKEDGYYEYLQDCKNLGIVPVASRMEDYSVWEPHWRSLPKVPAHESSYIQKPIMDLQAISNSSEEAGKTANIDLNEYNTFKEEMLTGAIYETDVNAIGLLNNHPKEVQHKIFLVSAGYFGISSSFILLSEGGGQLDENLKPCVYSNKMNLVSLEKFMELRKSGRVKFIKRVNNFLEVGLK